MIQFYFIILSISATELITNHCPPNFNLTPHNTTQKIYLYNLAHSFYSPYLPHSDHSKIKSVIKANDNTLLYQQIYSMILPYAILAGLTLIIYSLLIICCIFQKKCPPCSRCRRDLQQKPYYKKQLCLHAIFSIIFGFFSILVCMILLSTLSNIKQSIQLTNCGVYNMIDSTINGNIKNRWGGINGLKLNLDKISYVLVNSASIFVQSYMQNDFLLGDIDLIINSNIQLYQKYKNSRVINTDPRSVVGSLTPSVFIQNRLGPYGTKDTMIYDIDQSLERTRKLSKIAYNLDQSILLLNDSLGILIQKIQLVTDRLLSNNEILNNTINSIDIFSNLYLKTYPLWAISIFQFVIGFTLIISMIKTLSIFSLFTFNLKNCIHIIHCSWLLLGLIQIGIIFLMFLSIPVASLAIQFCYYYETLLNDQQSFHQFAQSNFKQIFLDLQTCFFDNGNILQKIELEDQLIPLQQLLDIFQQFKRASNSQSNNYIDISYAGTTINGWIMAMSNYSAGIYIDSYPQVMNDANPIYALKNLNKYSVNNTSLDQIPCTKDQWVFDYQNCTSKNVYSPSSDISYSLLIDTSSIWCYSFNTQIMINSHIWSESDFQLRYSKIKDKCPVAYENIISYGYHLIKFRDSRMRMFDSIKNDLNQILGLYKQYGDKLVQFKFNMNNMQNEIKMLNLLINDNLTGLNNIKNCKILFDNMDYIYRQFCQSLIPEVVKISICIIILSPIILILTILGCLLAIRYQNLKVIEQVEKIESSQVNIQKNQQQDNQSMSD